jgi:hypothetical protein
MTDKTSPPGRVTRRDVQGVPQSIVHPGKETMI